ncbi:WecB/TagA/CpsF family glycosyltransferase [Methylopila sp. M107]|uniref:WecB/TagA/CpsF family glycosyltransferase n=1 Tax=Methylopila sp. M107 TaxID=1101190 RepID=UPI00036231A7|nr:WecB/TagA/CpsF family glycosyltransferase [Methylopila sp. M107]
MPDDPIDQTPAIYQGPERRWLGSYLRVGALEIPYVNRASAIQAIEKSFEDRRQIRVAFCNANTMLKALDSRDYMRALGRFLVLNDGLGVDICSRLFAGRRFEQNLNGTDFIPALMRESGRDLKIFLLGAKPGVADEAARQIEDRYPRHRVVGTHDGYFTDAEAPEVVAEINAAAPDLLLVALGNPRQEMFVAAHAASIEAPAVIMVGALFDFIAGRVARAPKIVQTLRAEWLFRLAQEPRRLGKRYTVDVVRFFATIFWLRFRGAVAGIDLAARRLRPES